MCSTSWIHKEIDRCYNKFSSNHKRSLPPAYIDDVINEALRDYVEIFYSGNNAKKYKFGFEVTQQRMDMLSTLVIGYPKQPKLEYSDFNEDFNVYEFKLSELEYDYAHLIRAFASSDCGLINIDIQRHDNLNVVLEDEMKKPSKTWKRLIGAIKSSQDEEGSSLYVYTGGEIEVDSIYPEYIKKPRKVFVGGYNSLEYQNGDTTAYNKNDDPVDPDIPELYCSTIVDMAVQILSGDLYDTLQRQIREDKIMTTT